MPEEPCSGFHNIVQEAVIKTIPKKKKCKKAKWLPKEALRKEEKLKAKEKRKDIPILMQSPKNSKERQESFPQGSMQEIEKNNTMGKTRDLFKKIRDIQGILHANMGTIKDRNGMGLTEVGDIKKRWQEYTEKLHKKDLHDPDNNDDVITHLQPDMK